MALTCPSIEDRIEQILSKVLTQYRESPKLLQTARDFMIELAEISDELCHLPEKFDLDTAIGHQLTLIGKWLGWPRTHCRAVFKPVFGFDCEDDCEHMKPVSGFCGPVVVTEEFVPFGFCDGEPGVEAVTGFCEAEPIVRDEFSKDSWEDCGGPRYDDYTFDDDELYRRYLKARRYQFLGLFDYESLKICLQLIWGPEAWVADFRTGSIVVATGRRLTNDEKARLPLMASVLPVAPGVDLQVHLDPGPIFGFGHGWGGFCIQMNVPPPLPEFGFLCEDDPNPVTVGGFCEDTGLIITEVNGNMLNPLRIA